MLRLFPVAEQGLVQSLGFRPGRDGQERDEQMGCPSGMRPDMSVTDIAFCILKNRGQSMHFKELITEVMRVKAINHDNPGRLIAQMHTEINLDSRFLHRGNGEWGLREWLPKQSKVVKIRPESAAAASRPRPLLRADEEDEERFDGEEDESFSGREAEEEEADSEEYDEDEDEE